MAGDAGARSRDRNTPSCVWLVTTSQVGYPKPVSGQVARLLASHFPGSERELVVGELPVSALAERFGTPLYVYDRGAMERRLQAVRSALGPRVDVLFALKANPSVGVAQVFAEAGAGAEVASAGEIVVARHAGFEGHQMQFAGPGKHGPDLDHALSAGVTLNVESRGELEAIAAAAAAREVQASVALRVNPPASMSGSRMRMSGGSAKFGIDVDLLDEVARRATEMPSVRLVGLHTYAGTQTFDAEGWLRHARALLEAAAQVEAATGAPLERLNFGGGFGVPLFAKDTPFDLASAGEGLRALIAEDAREDRRYAVELGRFLVAEAGLFLTRVLYVKESQGTRHAILDGGMNQHAAATGVGSVFQRSFPVVKANDVRAEGEAGCRLGGPLCTPADAFPEVPGLPELVPGDLVAFLASGAYGLTFSNVLFLSHPLPAEVLVDGDRAVLLRERGAPEDALRGQRRIGEGAPA